MVAVDLREDGGEGLGATAEELVGLRADAVRVVADAVLHRGGTIELLDAASTVVSFARAGEAAALGAATELAQRVASVNRRRLGAGLRPLRLGIGVAEGDALTLEARGSRAQVHAVARSAVERAAALATAAADGEVLADEALRRAAPPGEAPSWPPRSVPGRAGPIAALVVPCDTTDLPPPEPITMKAPRP